MPWSRVLAFASVVVGSAVPAVAQSVKLNDPLARRALDRVQGFVLGPDGTRTVFQAGVNLFSAPADASAAPLPIAAAPFPVIDLRVTPDGSRAAYLLPSGHGTQLFTVPLDASQSPRILNGALVSGGNVARYEITPDGARLVYLAEQDTNEVFELYACAADGSVPPLKLSGALVAGGDVQSAFRLTPDGLTVVYLADQDANDVFDLYAVPLDGSAPPVRLNLTRPNADVQTDFALAWDSLGVVYRADQDADEVFELYAARIDGSGSSVKRSAPLVAGGDVLSFRLSGVNDRLLYRADQEVNERVELYSTHAIAGGTPVKLNGTLVANGDVNDAQLGADGVRVVYRADQLTNDIDELFGAPASGSAAAVRLSAPVAGLVAGSFQLPAGSGRVLYTLESPNGSSQLFSAPLDGSQPPKRLDEAQVEGGLGCLVQDVLADGTVLFTTDAEAVDHRELFRVPLDGSASPQRLSANLVSGGKVVAAHSAGAGSDVVYLAEQDHSDAQELFSVPTTGGAVRRLSDPLPLGEVLGRVDVFACSADGRRVLYTAREDSADVYDLYGVASDGSGHSAQLNRPFSAFDNVLGEFLASPDGARTAFRLAHDSFFTIQLHGAPTDATRAAVRLDEPSDLPNGLFQAVAQFAFTPDSTRIVYVADQDRDDVFELFVVPSDGSQPAARLHPPLAASVRIGQFGLSPDGAWVVFARSSAAAVELYSLPLDGHQPPARLNAPFVAGGNLGGDSDFGGFYPWQVTPDSSRVVYLADQDTNDVSELYSVPIDGSQAPVKLNGTLVAGGDVLVDLEAPLSNSPYLISPDGARVVYRADQEQDGRSELYSVPILGGPAVKLNAALVAGGNVASFAIEPGSTRVVYVADEATDGVPELFSVPLTGGARVRLSASLLPGEGVLTDSDRGAPFRVSTLGTVCYRQRSSGRFELWSAPLAGGTAPLRLNAPLPPGGNVLPDFELTVDGAGAVYAADQLANELFELFLTPLDASAPPHRVSGEMVSGGDVLLDRGTFRITGDGRSVIYRADQDTDGVPELYAGLLDFQRGPRRAGTPTRTVVR